MNHIRFLSTIRSKNSATRNYMKQQLQDEFAKKAREHNYRARSAFKLQEMDEKFKLFRAGDVVVDVGAAPGSWTQYLVERVHDRQRRGFVLGVDLKLIQPVVGATFLGQCDITKKETHDKIVECIGDRLVDAVISDMAPNPSGDKQTDQIRLVELCRMVVQLISTPNVIHLKEDGKFLCKVWEGNSRKELTEELKTKFEIVKTIKPKACKDDSAELYILAKNPIKH
uniref:FtsJ domain-containing protein n=1 Tax=Rhabditophanes sp. KR3021 TaxID=114890 RepID=A0AC35TG03_9BILA